MREESERRKERGGALRGDDGQYLSDTFKNCNDEGFECKLGAGMHFKFRK